MIKKGIILAGGTGSRMSPLTKAVNKQLLPLYDKPLIFYPLSVLMLAGIKNILIIVNKGQLSQFKKVLPEKNNLGLSIQYKEQLKPSGLPEAFTIGESFIGKDKDGGYFSLIDLLVKDSDKKVYEIGRKANKLAEKIQAFSIHLIIYRRPAKFEIYYSFLTASYFSLRQKSNRAYRPIDKHKIS